MHARRRPKHTPPRVRKGRYSVAPIRWYWCMFPFRMNKLKELNSIARDETNSLHLNLGATTIWTKARNGTATFSTTVIILSLSLWMIKTKCQRYSSHTTTHAPQRARFAWMWARSRFESNDVEATACLFRLHAVECARRRLCELVRSTMCLCCIHLLFIVVARRYIVRLYSISYIWSCRFAFTQFTEPSIQILFDLANREKKNLFFDEQNFADSG